MDRYTLYSRVCNVDANAVGFLGFVYFLCLFEKGMQNPVGAPKDTGLGG